MKRFRKLQRDDAGTRLVDPNDLAFGQFDRDAGLYHYVPAAWLAQWRSFTANDKNDSVAPGALGLPRRLDRIAHERAAGPLDASELLCKHGGAMFAPGALGAGARADAA